MSAAVPQIEYQVAKKPDMTEFDVDRGAESPSVAGDVVGEDDRSHRSLSRPGFTHQQHFLLHDDGFWRRRGKEEQI